MRGHNCHNLPDDTKNEVCQYKELRGRVIFYTYILLVSFNTTAILAILLFSQWGPFQKMPWLFCFHVAQNACSVFFTNQALLCQCTYCGCLCLVFIPGRSWEVYRRRKIYSPMGEVKITAITTQNFKAYIKHLMQITASYYYCKVL